MQAPRFGLPSRGLGATSRLAISSTAPGCCRVLCYALGHLCQSGYFGGHTSALILSLLCIAAVAVPVGSGGQQAPGAAAAAAPEPHVRPAPQSLIHVSHIACAVPPADSYMCLINLQAAGARVAVGAQLAMARPTTVGDANLQQALSECEAAVCSYPLCLSHCCSTHYCQLPSYMAV